MKWDVVLPMIALVAVVGGLIVYSNTGSGLDDREVIRPRPDRVQACERLIGELDQRLDACFKDLKPARLSKAATDVISGMSGGSVMAAARLSIPGTEVGWLADHPELVEALLSTDEAEAAKALRDAGVRGFVVSRDLRGALDRDARTLARLVYRDHIEWFQLRHVTEDLLIYTVRSSRMRIPLATGDSLLKGLRARIAGETPQPQRWKPQSIRLIGSMRLQGHTLVRRHAVGSDIEKVLDELGEKLVREWERNVVIEGHGNLEDRLDDLRIEVHVVMERAQVEPRSRFAIFDLWELGVDGMMFRHRRGMENQKFTYVPGSEAVNRSLNSPDRFLRYAVQTGGWRNLRPWEDTSTRLDIIRTQHFMEAETGGGPAVRLVRGLPEIPMSYVTDRNVQDMLVRGGEWWLHNQFEDGGFEYKFWPDQNRRSFEYNEVRHILAARDLADTYRYRHDPRYLDGSWKSMEWLLKYAVHDTDEPDSRLPHPGPGAMLFRYPSFEEYRARTNRRPPNQKLGTVAVALLGWVAWADATGSKAQDENIRKMAQFTLDMFDEREGFQAYYVPRNHAYHNQKNDIVPGEAALALGMVAEYFGEMKWVDFFPKFINYYKPWFSERAVKQQPHGRWPHDTYTNEMRLDLVQFGPWSVMASKQYYLLTGNEEAADFGLEVADWMIDNYQWSGERSPWPDFVGGYYKLPNELPAMQSFCYSEGTAAAYHIAATHAPDRRDKYLTSTQEAIRFLEVMMYDDLDTYFLPRPQKVHGGVKYAMNENKVRTDYVGHGLSTLSQYLDARRYDPAVELDIVDPAVLAKTYESYRLVMPEVTGVGEADPGDEGGDDPSDANEG